MNYRQLGTTGVQVSPLCLGAMMFGAWGNTDHDDSVRIIHRALDAGINFIDTADVYSRGESEEIVAKALAGGKRDNVVLATKVHGTMGEDPNEFGNSRRWIIREVENSLRRLEDRLDRPLPDPSSRGGHEHRRDARRADGPRPRRQGPLHRLLDVPRQPDRRGPVGRRAPRPRAVRVRAAAVLDARPGDRVRRAADVQALRDGSDPVEPAGRRLAVGRLPDRPGPAEVEPRRPAPGPLRPQQPGQPAQARGGRRAREARRRDRDLTHRDGPRVGDPASGGDRGDHRTADDGAPRVASCRPPT